MILIRRVVAVSETEWCLKGQLHVLKWCQNIECYVPANPARNWTGYIIKTEPGKPFVSDLLFISYRTGGHVG